MVFGILPGSRRLVLFVLFLLAEKAQGFLAWQTLGGPQKLISDGSAILRCSRHRPPFGLRSTYACQDQSDQNDLGSQGRMDTQTLLRQAPPPIPPLHILVPAVVGGWLSFGTLFYHFHTGWPFEQAFFFAVDTGLSIGFGSIGVEDDASRIFTILHVLFGAGVASVALALYTDAILARSNEDFVKNYAQLTDDDDQSVGVAQFEDLKGLLAFFAWVGVGICYGIVREGWTPVQSLYFAVAAMATGGLESPSVDVGQGTNAVLAGLFSLIGVPIFAYNLGNVAALIEGRVTSRREIEALLKQMDKEEFEIAASIVAPDQEIDRAEFVVLELIRLNKIDAATVDLIMKRFDMLDSDNSGFLTPQETYLRAATPKGQLGVAKDWSDSDSE